MNFCANLEHNMGTSARITQPQLSVFYMCNCLQSDVVNIDQLIARKY